MPAIRPLALASLLCVALVSAAVAAPAVASDATVDRTSTAATVVPATNTTEYLTVEDGAADRSRYGSASLDVAGAIAVDTATLRGRYRKEAVRTAFRNASSRERRTEILRDEAARIEDRIDALQQRQRRVLAAYNAGSISTDRFLRELAQIDATARSLRTQLRTMRTDLGTALLWTRFRGLEARLIGLYGPVRQRFAHGLAGNVSRPTYVLTAEEALVLSTTTRDGQFVREAYLGSERVPGGVDVFKRKARNQTSEFAVDFARQRAIELYPWTFQHAFQSPVRGYPGTSVYRIPIRHPQGRLVTYLDGVTQTAFREVQVKNLVTVPTTVYRNETETAVLRVGSTHPTGPLRVALTRPGGTPLDARVRINGHFVGSTGGDGRLWTVAPRGYTRINVTTADGETTTLGFYP